MAKIKRKTSHVEESGFSIYDGDTPRVGQYRAVIASLKVRESNSGSGNLYYNVLARLENNVGSKAEYDGFPAWVMLTMTDKEANLRREKAFYRAIGVDEDAELDYDPKTGEVKSIGGKKVAKILGTAVIVDMRLDTSREPSEVRGDTIFPAKVRDEDADAEPEEPELEEDEDEDEDDSDLEETEEESEDEESDEEADERRGELEGMSLVKLKKVLKDDHGLSAADVKGLDKEDAIEAIMDREFSSEDEEDEEDEEAFGYDELKALKVKDLRSKVKELWDDEDELGVEHDDLDDMSKAEILDHLVEAELVEAPPAF